MPHLRFEPCQVLLDLEVVEVFRRRSFLEEVVEVFRHRSFLEVVEVAVEGVPFLPQEEEEEEEEEEVPFLPQVVVVEVEEAEVLRLQDLLEEVSVQSFCAPNWLVGVGK
jgi:hypothetical protein